MNNHEIPPEWIRKQSPKEMGVGMGWFGELSRAYAHDSGEYAVMIRDVQTDWGIVQHACIRNATNTDVPWREKQKIKNELFGPECTAIEFFPAESVLTDDAMMYHFWVLPDDIELPFGLHL